MRLAALVLTLATLPAAAQPAPTFDVAAIHLSSAHIPYERNGETHFLNGTLTMQDVNAATCIALAYNIPLPLITGPAAANLDKTHYDILAKTDPATTPQQMHLMLQQLLHDRFNLAFHREKKELNVYALEVSKSGLKIHESAPDTIPSRQNSNIGMIAHALTLDELAAYLSDPLGAPLTNNTGLKGRYDITIDFTPYVDNGPSDVRPDPIAVLRNALKGELGLDIVKRREAVDTFVVDHVEPPSSN